MEQHDAYVQQEFNGEVKIQKVETPRPGSGQVLVKVSATPLLSYTKAVLSGELFPLVHPLVPGIAAIGRVSQCGPDIGKLQPGQLVFCNPAIVARDDPSSTILQGWFGGVNDVARNLMRSTWRNGTWAEYVLCPAENALPLDEQRLLNELAYTPSDLVWINELLVPFGGWKAASVIPGETVIVAPASGHFGRAAIWTALAMGAKKVIAAARSEIASDLIVQSYGTGRFCTVELSGDTEQDTKALIRSTPYGLGAHAYLDFSPPQATTSTHPVACIGALKPGGRAVLMGGVQRKIEIDYGIVMLQNITIKGNFMYTTETAQQLVAMVETGLIDLRKFETSTFPFTNLEEGIECAEKRGGADKLVVLQVDEEL